MNKNSTKILVFLLFCLLSISLIQAQAPLRLPREETIYISGFQWGPPTNFNPFPGNPAWPNTPASGSQLIYEPLFTYKLYIPINYGVT